MSIRFSRSMLLVVAVLLLPATVVAGPPGGATGENTGVGPESLTSPDSFLGDEFRISTPSSPDCPRSSAGVAYDWIHREYLVVWLNSWSPGYQDVYAQRVTSKGELKTKFTITAGINQRRSPAIAFNGSDGEYLVVYSYDRWNNGQYELWGRVVAWNGGYMSPELLIFTWPNRAFYYPRVVWNSYRNEYMVISSVWDTDNLRWNDVARRRVMPDGSMPYAGSAVYQNPLVQPHQADIAYNLATDEYLVVWRQQWSGDDWDIKAARMNYQGTVIDPPGILTVNNASVDQQWPAVASNDQDQYMVVWEQGVGLPATDWDLVSQKLDSQGYWAAPVKPLITTPENTLAPAIAYNRGLDSWLVAYEDWFGGASIRFLEWPAGGGYVNAGFLSGMLSPDYARPQVAAGNREFFAVYKGYSLADLSVISHIFGRSWYHGPQVFVPMVLRKH